MIFKYGDTKCNVFPSDRHCLLCKARSCAKREGEIERHVRVEKIYTISLYCVEEARKKKQDENKCIHTFSICIRSHI